MRVGLACCLTLIFSLAASADDWTGKSVQVKKDGVKLGRKLGGGLVRDGDLLDKSKTYIVKSDDGTFLELPGGFLYKAEAELAAVAKLFPKDFKRDKPGDPPVAGGWAYDTQLMFVRPRSEVPFGDWIEGKQVELPPPLALVVTVRKDNGDGWVRIFDGRREGWVLKESLVTVMDARTLWDRMLTKNPKDAYALMMRGLTSAYGGDHDKAIADYTESFRLDPRSFDAIECRGYAWLNKRDHDKAIADFTEAIKLQPKNHGVIFQRGMVWLAKKDYDKAIADFTEARKLEPGNWSAIVNRGEAWLAKKDYDKAIADFTEAIKQYPRNPQPFAQRGNAWLAKKDYDKAIADFTEVNKLDSINWSALLARGGALLGKKDYDKAIADFTEVIKLEPKNSLALAGRADALYSKKEYAKSLLDHDAWIILKPKDVLAHTSRAMVQAKLKKYDAAVKDFEKALELNPNFLVYREYAKFRASCPDAKFRDGPKAVELAKVALQKLGGSAGWKVRDAAAMAFAEAGDFARAVAEQQKAINRLKGLGPTDPDADELKGVETRLELYKAKKPYRDVE